MLFGYSDSSRAEGEPLVFGFKHMLKTLWQCVFPLMKLNLAFLLFCLPVVTIPPAVTALHAGCVDLIRGEKCKVFRVFLRTIWHQFFQSWCIFLILGALEFVSVFGAWFYFQKENILTGILGLFMAAVAVVTLLMVPYCFCMLSRVDLSLKNTLKNAFLVSFLNLKFSVCSGVLTLTLAVCQILWWLYMIPLVLLIGASLTAYLGCYFSLFGLQRFVLTEDL